MNEVLFGLLILGGFGVVILASKWGLFAIQCAAVALALTTTVIAGKLVPVFGLVSSAGTATFLSLGLASDLIAEIYGRKEALKTVALTFAANVTLLLLGLLTTQLAEAEPSATGTALSALFNWLPRLLLGGLAAYLVSQSFDVWVFSLLKKMTSGRWLWLRVTGSTAISQLVDTVLVWTIAFGGIIDHLGQVILTAYITKLAAAFIEAPFSYLARSVNPDYRNVRPKPTEAFQNPDA